MLIFCNTEGIYLYNIPSFLWHSIILVILRAGFSPTCLFPCTLQQVVQLSDPRPTD